MGLKGQPVKRKKHVFIRKREVNIIERSLEIFVDNFAGGGGASTGIEGAIGRSVDVAINHDLAAIAMHEANHPETEHYCESVWTVDPRVAVRSRPVALAWFSPDCKHFSRAKGGTPVDKDIRGLAWVAVRWAATVMPRVIMLENVVEFTTWGPLIPVRDKETGRIMKKVFSGDDGDFNLVVSESGEVVPPELRVMIPDPKRKGHTFNSFVNALRYLGYEVEWRELQACDYGAPTTRKRLFMVARCDGEAIVWPEATHGAPDSPEVQSGKRLAWRTAEEIIDWSIPCPSIFERKKDLAENTMRRIARGLKRFIIDNPDPFVVPDPFVMRVNFAGSSHHYCDSIKEPLKTITAKNGWSVVTPYITRIGQTGFGGDRLQYKITDPLTTVTTKTEHLLVTPQLREFESTGEELVSGDHHHADQWEHKQELVASFLAKHYGGNYTGPGANLKDPLPTVTTVDHNALVTSHLVKLRGTCKDGQPVNQPMPTITAGGLHVGEVRAFLIKYYGSAENGQSLNEPLHTVTTKDRFGLLTIHGVQYQIVDIGMRMLEPHELFAANGFPKNYIINVDANGNKYSKKDQVARCGNAVPPPFAKALVQANLPEHCVGSGSHLSLERYAEPEYGQMAFSL